MSPPSHRPGFHIWPRPARRAFRPPADTARRSPDSSRVLRRAAGAGKIDRVDQRSLVCQHLVLRFPHGGKRLCPTAASKPSPYRTRSPSTVAGTPGRICAPVRVFVLAACRCRQANVAATACALSASGDERGGHFRAARPAPDRYPVQPPPRFRPAGRGRPLPARPAASARLRSMAPAAQPRCLRRRQQQYRCQRQRPAFVITDISSTVLSDKSMPREWAVF